MTTHRPPKAESVTREGAPDGFVPPTFYRPELLSGGFTRVTVSVPPERLEAVHRALVAALEPPLKLMYRQLTDRRAGQLEKPISRVGVELPRDRVLDALTRWRDLVYHDGRHQLWIRGAAGEQVVLEEVGVIYVYPDDPSFHDVLEQAGVPKGAGPTLAERDYIRVQFSAANDQAEAELIDRLHLVEWAG